MARKNEQTLEMNEPVAQEVAQEVAPTDPTPVKAGDPWSKKVAIKLPKVPGEPNYLIASVNGRVFQIKRGEQIEVPAPIAEVLEHSFKAEEDAESFIESAAG